MIRPVCFMAALIRVSVIGPLIMDPIGGPSNDVPERTVVLKPVHNITH